MRPGFHLALLAGLFALSASIVPAGTVAAQSVPTLDDFAALSDIRDVRLSPSGNRVMIIRKTDADAYQIELRETANIGQGGFAFGTEPAQIRGAGWLTEDRIIVIARQRPTSGRASRWVEKLLIFDDKGQIRGGLPGGDPEILANGRREAGILYLSVHVGQGIRDVVRFDVRSGRTERILRGSDRRGGFLVDNDGEVRFSTMVDIDKFEVKFFARRKGQSDWTLIHDLSPARRETWQPLGFFTDNPDELTVLATDGDDKAALRIFDLAQGRITRTLYSRDDVSIDDAVVSRSGQIVGARFATKMRQIHWLEPARDTLAKTLAELLPDRGFEISDASASGHRIVRASGPKDPASFYLVDGDGTIQALGSGDPQFVGKTLAETEFTAFKARDGLSIPLYLTKPSVGTGPFPLIVLPHGGPWARDFGGFDRWAQFLASRGYLVAQPQFRGSDGFGVAHWQAGDREWGGKMQDDLDDAVLELRKQGIAAPDRAAIFGWSYGGYAALVGSIRGNGLYRCALAGAAVSDLDQVTALLSNSFYARIVQKPTIKGLNPVDNLGNANIPLLILHGDEDTIVDVSHGRAAAAALTAAGKSYRYKELKRVGHLSDQFTFEQSRQLLSEFDTWFSKECF